MASHVTTESTDLKPVRWGGYTSFAPPKVPDTASIRSASVVISRDVPVRNVTVGDDSVVVARRLLGADAAGRWLDLEFGPECNPADNPLRVHFPELPAGSHDAEPPALVRVLWTLVHHDWFVPGCEFPTAEAAVAADKMVFVVNQSLQMGKGKVAAQVGHAAAALGAQTSQRYPKVWLRYRAQGEAKIVLKAPNQATMDAVAKLPGACVIIDAGRTQIAPGSMTVVGFPPCRDPHPQLRKLKLL